MSSVNRLVSELVRSANSIDRLSATTVRRMLEDAIEAIRQLRFATNIVPIPGKDAVIYIRTVAAGADRVPPDEWRHALLHAAEMIRDLSIVVDSRTMIRIVRDEPDPATSFETKHD